MGEAETWGMTGLCLLLSWTSAGNVEFGDLSHQFKVGFDASVESLKLLCALKLLEDRRARLVVAVSVFQSSDYAVPLQHIGLLASLKEVFGEDIKICSLAHGLGIIPLAGRCMPSRCLPLVQIFESLAQAGESILQELVSELMIWVIRRGGG